MFVKNMDLAFVPARGGPRGAIRESVSAHFGGCPDTQGPLASIDGSRTGGQGSRTGGQGARRAVLARYLGAYMRLYMRLFIKALAFNY